MLMEIRSPKNDLLQEPCDVERLPAVGETFEIAGRSFVRENLPSYRAVRINDTGNKESVRIVTAVYVEPINRRQPQRTVAHAA